MMSCAKSKYPTSLPDQFKPINRLRSTTPSSSPSSSSLSKLRLKLTRRMKRFCSRCKSLGQGKWEGMGQCRYQKGDGDGRMDVVVIKHDCPPNSSPSSLNLHTSSSAFSSLHACTALDFHLSPSLSPRLFTRPAPYPSHSGTPALRYSG